MFVVNSTEDTITTVSSFSDHNNHNIPESKYVFVIMTGVTSALSVIGGSCICALYYVFKDMRTPVRQLLLFLAISDTLLALGNLLGVIWYLYRDSTIINNSRGFCIFQSAMTIYFSFTSFFWTVTMAMSLFATVVLGKPSFTATYMKLFHLLAWIPPGLILIIALGLGVLGTDTRLAQPSWCWIDPRAKHALLWQFVAAKFWEILAYVTTLVLYATVKIFLRRRASMFKRLANRKRSGTDLMVEASRKLTFVPFVFIICRIWGTLRFLIGNFDKDHVDEPYVTWINPLQGIGDSAQGFANFIIYCYSLKRVRQRVGRYLCPALVADMHTDIENPTKSMKKSRVDVVYPSKVESRERIETRC